MRKKMTFRPFTEKDFRAAVFSDGRKEILGLWVTQRQYDVTIQVRGKILPHYIVPYDEQVKSDDEIHTMPEHLVSQRRDSDVRVWCRDNEHRRM